MAPTRQMEGHWTPHRTKSDKAQSHRVSFLPPPASVCDRRCCVQEITLIHPLGRSQNALLRSLTRVTRFLTKS